MLTIEAVIRRAPEIAPYCSAWLSLFLVFVGIGATLRYSFSNSAHRERLVWLDFWVGFSVATVLLQTLHLFLPIDSRAALFLVVCAIPGSVVRLRELKLSNLGRATTLAPLVIVVGLIPWLALRLAGPVLDGDTGLYHMQTVMWASAFPIVPGLGNLHDRLAFNSVYHLYAALCDAWPSPLPSFRIVNGPIFLVSLAQLVRVAFQPADSKWMRARRAFCLLMVGPLFLQTLNSQFYGLSPDFSIFALEVVLARLLFQVLQRGDSLHSTRYPLAVLPLLCALAITLKLSAAAVAVATCAVGLVQVLRIDDFATKRSRLRTLGAGASAAGLALGIWALSGTILSGYPLYPVHIISVPVEWRIPRPLAMSIDYWIRSWARIPIAHWVDVLGSWEWIPLWLDRSVGLLQAPLIGTAIGAILGSIAWIRSGRPAWRPLLILMPPVVGLAAWFATAPDVRFARGPIWISTAGILAMGISALFDWGSVRTRWLIDFGSGLALLMCIVPSENLRPPPPSEHGFPPPELRQFITRFGTRINYGAPGHRCWDAPPPCTPYLRSSLRLRQPGVLASGFVLDDPFECIDMHSCRPPGVQTPPNVGIDLHRGEWQRLPGSTAQWMNTRGRIILYVEEPRGAILRLHPTEVAPIADNGTLKISLNGKSLASRRIELARDLDLPLELREGFNVVSLVLAEKLAETAGQRPWNPARGEPAVGFSTIAILESEPLAD